MDPFRGLLLNVWKETCRHIEIQEATENIAAMLAQQMPLSAVLICRFDAEHHGLITVARAQVDDELPSLPTFTQLSQAAYKRLVAWARSGLSLHKSHRHLPREAGCMTLSEDRTASPAPPLPRVSFGALSLAAGTLVQVGTSATPYVRTMDLAAPNRIGGSGR